MFFLDCITMLTILYVFPMKNQQTNGYVGEKTSTYTFVKRIMVYALFFITLQCLQQKQGRFANCVFCFTVLDEHPLCLHIYFLFDVMCMCMHSL